MGSPLWPWGHRCLKWPFLIAALRRHADVAVGNILGSNIFNVLGILGISAFLQPLPIAARVSQFDQWIMLGSSKHSAAVSLHRYATITLGRCRAAWWLRGLYSAELYYFLSKLLGRDVNLITNGTLSLVEGIIS